MKPLPACETLIKLAKANFRKNLPKIWNDDTDRAEILTNQKPDGDIDEIPKTCFGCNIKIFDRYLLQVDWMDWHEKCVTCSACGIQLSNSCFLHQNKLYCKYDYERLFREKCNVCDEMVYANDYVQRPVSGHLYHLDCFNCFYCKKPLTPGQKYMINDDGKQLICELDIFAVNQCVKSQKWFNAVKTHGRKGSKKVGEEHSQRFRTQITNTQKKILFDWFEKNPYIFPETEEAILKETSLEKRVVRVWFQNQRAQRRKMLARINGKKVVKKKCDQTSVIDGNATLAKIEEPKSAINSTSSVYSRDSLDLSTDTDHRSQDNSSFTSDMPMD